MKSKKLPKYVMYSYLALLIATVIWAGANPVIKLTLNYVPLFTFLFIRFLLVGIILLPYVVLQLSKQKIYKEDYINIILLGLFGQAGIGFVFAGLKYTSAIDTAVLGLIAPILAIWAGHYFYKEKVNIYVKTGVILATFGTLFVTLEPILTQSSSGTEPLKRLWGNILVLMYDLSFLTYIIWSKMSLGITTPRIKKALNFIHLKPMKGNYSAVMLTVIMFYVALAVFTPLAFLENLGVFGPVSFNLSEITLVPLIGILYMALLSSIVAYTLFEWALKVSSVGDTALFTYLGPIFTLPFAYVLLREVPTPLTIIGTVIIAMGVVIAELRKA